MLVRSKEEKKYVSREKSHAEKCLLFSFFLKVEGEGEETERRNGSGFSFAANFCEFDVSRIRDFGRQSSEVRVMWWKQQGLHPHSVDDFLCDLKQVHTTLWASGSQAVKSGVKLSDLF